MKKIKIGEGLGSLLAAVVAQGEAYEQRARSVAERRYGSAMQAMAETVREFTRTASFDELIRAEKAFQKNDLTIYAQRPETAKSVQEGMDDILAGETAYRQLVNNTEAYREHGYRKKECVPPEYVIPIDAMRRTLRGQIKRVENYRANVMGNIQEQAFLSARIDMLKRAEELYDSIQREQLLLPEREDI